MFNRTDASIVALTDPAFDGFGITPDDGTDLSQVTRAVWVGNGGSVIVVLAGGGQVTLANVVGGSILPIQAKRILATGTTASGLVGLY